MQLRSAILVFATLMALGSSARLRRDMRMRSSILMFATIMAMDVDVNKTEAFLPFYKRAADSGHTIAPTLLNPMRERTRV